MKASGKLLIFNFFLLSSSMLFGNCPDIPGEPREVYLQPQIDKLRSRNSAIECHVEDYKRRRKAVIEKHRLNIKAQGVKTRGHELVELASIRSLTSAFRQLLATYWTDCEPIWKEAQEVFRDFRVFEQASDSRRSKLTAILDGKSKLDLGTIAQIKVEILSWHQEEFAEATSFFIRGLRLLSELSYVEADHDSDFLRLRSFMTDNQLGRPILLKVLDKKLRELVGAAEVRAGEFSRFSTGLLAQLQIKQEILIADKTNRETKQALRDAKLLNASNTFLMEVKDALVLAWQPWDVSNVADISFLEVNYLNKAKLAELKGLCTNPSDDRKTGCLFLEQEFRKLDQFLNKTLPRKITSQIARLETSLKPADKIVVEQIQEAIQAKRWHEAVRLHDDLIRRSAK